MQTERVFSVKWNMPCVLPLPILDLVLIAVANWNGRRALNLPERGQKPTFFSAGIAGTFIQLKRDIQAAS
jgi:hypothetical protein